MRRARMLLKGRRETEMNKINRMYFSGPMFESGEMAKFIETLCAQAYCKQDPDVALYNDIRIRPEDCGAFSVEWVQVPWDGAYGGSFQYVDEDEVVCFERKMPDNTYQRFASEEEYQECLEEMQQDQTDTEEEFSPEAMRVNE